MHFNMKEADMNIFNNNLEDIAKGHFRRKRGCFKTPFLNKWLYYNYNYLELKRVPPQKMSTHLYKGPVLNSSHATNSTGKTATNEYQSKPAYKP